MTQREQDIAEAFFLLGSRRRPELTLSWRELIRKARAEARPDYAPAPPDALPHLLCFDVETSGSPGGLLVIQLAYVVVDAEFRILHEHCELLKLPQGERVHWHARKVHGISSNKVFLRGKPVKEELDAFFLWVRRVKRQNGLLIAHNAAFDASAITQTARRWDLPYRLPKSSCFCTMRNATAYCGLLNKLGRPKPPKNATLYRILAGGPPLWAKLHDALDDTKITLHNYKLGRACRWFQ